MPSLKPIKFDIDDWLNVPDIIPKYMKVICDQLNKGVNNWLKEHDRVIDIIQGEAKADREYVQQLEKRVDQERDAEKKRVNAEFEDLRNQLAALDKKIDNETKFRQQSIKEVEADVENRCDVINGRIDNLTRKQEADVALLQEKLAKMDTDYKMKMEQLNSKLVVLDKTMEKYNKETKENFKATRSSIEATKKELAKNIQLRYEMQTKALNDAKQDFENARKEEHAFTEKVRGDMILSIKRVAGDLNRTDNDLRETKEQFIRRFKTDELKVDQVKQQLLALILQTNDEFKKRLEDEATRLDSNAAQMDIETKERMSQLEIQRKDDEIQTNLKIEECHAAFGDELEHLRKNLNRYLMDTTRNPEVTQARLYSLETRLREEENSRLNEQSAINTALTTVVECVDENIKLLESKADRKEIAKLEKKVKSKPNLLEGVISHVSKRPRTRGTQSKKGGRGGSSPDEDVPYDERDPFWVTQNVGDDESERRSHTAGTTPRLFRRGPNNERGSLTHRETRPAKGDPHREFGYLTPRAPMTPRMGGGGMRKGAAPASFYKPEEMVTINPAGDVNIDKVNSKSMPKF
eukprot:GFYU01006374.1.p1 GENE.GFYU01006374.1~~GFYU01006374.1.p1  ORF type:complete len:578 (+),score=170.22 GFYU01006374.1:408-2141(+)